MAPEIHGHFVEHLGGAIEEPSPTQTPSCTEQYYEILAKCLRIDPLIRNHWDVMGEVDREHRIKPAVDGGAQEGSGESAGREWVHRFRQCR